MNRPSVLVFLVAFISLSSLVFAQEVNKAPEVQKFSIGIKLGPSVTFARYPEPEQRDRISSRAKFGYGGQVFVAFPLSRTGYTYLAEAGYAVRGRKVKLEPGGFVNNSTYQLIDLSMALRKSFDFQLAENLPAKWFANVGPNIQYWMSGKGKFVESKYDIQFSNPENRDLFSNYIQGANRWLFGIDVGVGADAPINNRQKIRVELRTTLGQTYLGKKDHSSTMQTINWYDDLKVNLKTISLTAAYSLDFDMRNMKMGKSNTTKSVKGNVGKYKSPNKKKKRRR